MGFFLGLLDDAIEEAIDEPIAKTVMRYLYNLTGQNSYSIEQVAKHIGISPKHIVELEKQSIVQLQTKAFSDMQKNANSASSRLAQYILLSLWGRGDKLIDSTIEFVSLEFTDFPERIVSLAINFVLANRGNAPIRRAIYAIRKELKSRNPFLPNITELISQITWFRIQKKWEQEKFYTKFPLSYSIYAQKFYSKKLGEMIYFSTGLERRFFASLESSHQISYYIPRPFFFFTDSHIHFADAFVLFQNGTGCVVELQPLLQMAFHENIARRNALKEYCTHTGMGLLITDGKRSLHQVENYLINPKKEEAFNDLLEKKLLNWQHYQKFQTIHSIKPIEFTALILKNNLQWQLDPFRIA